MRFRHWGGFVIDIANEQLLAFSEIPANVPPRPTGRRLHVSAPHRWATKGVGGVRLEFISIGGTRYTCGGPQKMDHRLR